MTLLIPLSVVSCLVSWKALDAVSSADDSSCSPSVARRLKWRPCAETCSNRNPRRRRRKGALFKQKPKAVVMEKLRQYGVGLRLLDDPFFDEGNKICRMYTQKGVIDEDQEELCHMPLKKFKCQVANCKVELDSLLNFEMHYNSCHRFSCSQCKKQLLSAHLLDLHLSETHDSFFQVQAERKPMYRCYVEECNVVSHSPKTRRAHCIEVHQFPHDFRSGTNSKSPGPSNKGTKSNGHSMTVDSSPENDEKTNRQKKVTEIKFGRKSNKSFEWHKVGQKSKNVDEATEKQKLTMQELMETLPLE